MPEMENSFLKQLNEVQRQAVTSTDGPVLVVAGPGSGKTRVLTFRIAHLIQKGVPPWEILALTFTNKAAREMKERIEKVVGPRANRVWAGTFHSIFARILRVEAEKIGYPSNFTIYDTEDTKSVLRAILKELNLSTEVYNINTIKARISSAKSNLITPTRYQQNAELMQQDKMAKRPHTQAIYAKYMARCKRSGAMDFDDLLYRLYELLYKHEDVRKKYRDRFSYLMVDEFQDTNHLQYEILKILCHYEGSDRNVCVVGDDAQSIYAFRGATIQNILDFESDFKSHGIQVYKLEQNYRSTDHIVQAANEVITHNQKQIPKKIWSNKGEGKQIKLIKAMTDQEEGKRVADTILEQKNRSHLSNKDIAILYRTNSQSRIFEEYLRRYNIPYRVFGGLSFYQRKEVKDLIAYFRLAINPQDEEALRRVINYPKRGIGATSVDKISSLAGDTNQPMWAVLPQTPLPNRTSKSLGLFVAMINDFRKRAATDDAYTLAVYIAKKSGLLDLLKSDHTVEGMNRLENVNSLLDGIKEFVESDPVIPSEEEEPDKSLAAYIQNIALLTDLDENVQSDDHVTLMSVHAAKGLEFPSIFLVGLEEKLFPSFMSMDTLEGIDEERRLFYVAITRAESYLTLSYAASRYRYGQMRYNEPSRFLLEVGQQHLDVAAPVSRSSNNPMDQLAKGVERFTQGGRSSGASVKGNFKRVRTSSGLKVDPKNFNPSSSDAIQTGMKVLHLKFGEGKVLAIDGGTNDRIATIHFKDIDSPRKKIMLRFAKLQILD